MILFQKTKVSEDMRTTRKFEIRLEVNLAFRLCYSQFIPFTAELGLGFITISYEIWRN
jgi:hypothetical protein